MTFFALKFKGSLISWNDEVQIVWTTHYGKGTAHGAIKIKGDGGSIFKVNG